MKVLLIGAGGQLAHDLANEFAQDELTRWTRAEIDLAKPEGAAEKIAAVLPDLVVNAAAYNLVDQAEKEPDAALAVNALGVRALALACDAIDRPLLHFSTDYVYGLETRTEPWRETDAPGPVSAYGSSKLTGEYFLRALCPRHFVVRTCGLYGVKGSRGKGGNFVETMLRLADGGKTVRVVDDQRCTPSFTADVAKAAAALARTSAYGLYHVTNAGGCSWFELAQEIFRQAGKNVDCQPITSAQFGAPARRPPFSILSNEKLAAAGVEPCADWQDALGRYLRVRPGRNV